MTDYDSAWALEAVRFLADVRRRYRALKVPGGRQGIDLALHWALPPLDW